VAKGSQLNFKEHRLMLKEACRVGKIFTYQEKIIEKLYISNRGQRTRHYQ
jgi:hypothetical protein